MMLKNLKFMWISLLAIFAIGCGEFEAGKLEVDQKSQSSEIEQVGAAGVYARPTGCGNKFDSLQNQLMKTLRDSQAAVDIGVVHQAHIAFNRFAMGPHARHPEHPQNYLELEELMGKAAATRALVDLIDQHFKWGSGRNNQVKDKIAELLPLTGLTYTQINNRLHNRFKAYQDAKANGTNAEILAAQQALNQLRGDLRKTAAEHAIAWGLNGALNVNQVLTEFWWNHFNVDAQKSYLHALDYERQLSKRVCGTFLDLLKTSAAHPAMLQYLDNYRSVKEGLKKKGFGTGINENYGRELLELYTFGIGPVSPAEPSSPYNQTDVTRVAKLLTGWSFTRTQGEQPQFVFNGFAHDTSRPKIMGQTFANGVNGGVELLQYLASHNQTKRNICKKLVTELAGDNANNGLHNACKNAWGTYGNLPAMYQAIITHPAYWRWANYSKSLKNPIELVTSAKRAMGYHIWSIQSRSELTELAYSSRSLGIYPRHFPPPTGYPVADRVWANPNYITQAINTAHKLADDRMPLIIDDKTYWNNGAENKIAQVAQTSPGLAANYVVRDQLRTYPMWFGLDAGHEQLKASIQSPDKEKSTNLLVPGRTVNSLILGSRMFVLK